MKQIRIKAQALSGCTERRFLKLGDYIVATETFVKVELIQNNAHCTTKAVNLYYFQDMANFIIEGRNLSSCQSSNLDLKLPSIEIKLHFSRIYAGEDVFVESL